MKLGKLFIYLSAAVLFTACSDDDKLPTPKMAEAYISLGATDGSVIAKATEDTGFTTESEINTLEVFVFDKSGQLVNRQKNNTTLIDHIKVEIEDYDDAVEGAVSTSEFSLVVAANMDVTFGATKTLEALKDLVLSSKITSYTTGSALPMMSEVIEFTGIKKDSENWVKSDGTIIPVTPHADYDGTAPTGYTKILVTRLVARIQLQSISVALQEDLVGGKFTLQNVFLANARPESYLIPQTTTALEVASTTPAYYHGIDRTTLPVKMQELVNAAGSNNSSFTKSFTNISIADQAVPHEFDYETDDATLPYWYAFENHGATENTKTYLIVAGTITPPGSGTATETRYYPVAITDTDQKGIFQNNIYQVNLTIKGLGSNEDVALIGGKVTVEPWKIIKHTEEITD